MKQGTATVNGSGVCSNCNSDDRWILHHVHHRNTNSFRRLCTTCVLKLHIASYCPVCFSLHGRPQKPGASMAIRGTLVCFKCNAIPHAACVAPKTHKSLYICPTCSNHKVKLFDLRNRSKIGGANQAIDLLSSKVFLAAATIAMNSLNEAKERLRVEAETKARESFAARKKAKNDLDQVAMAWIRVQEAEGNGEALVASVNGLAIKAPSSGVMPMDVDRAVVAPGRPLMAGTTVIVNNSHDKR